jgi:hypothetical protein
VIEQYIHQLSNKYVAYYDIYRNEILGSTPLSFLAVYKRTDERYVVTKRIKVWRADNHEYVFVTSCKSPLTREFLYQYKNDLLNRLDSFVPKNDEHMSTVFIAAVVTDQPVDEELIKEVKKYRKLKFIKYGLYGWMEVYIVIVDLKNKCVYTHKKAKPFVDPMINLLNQKGDD